MELEKPQDLLALFDGAQVTKRNLYDLIQYSKVEGSSYWAGESLRIGNTPQQGINWLGNLPNCQAVIIKTRHGSYAEDGWQDGEKSTYHYSLKATKYKISYTEKANSVLLDQPKYGYPILLFAERGSSWLFEGAFDVSRCAERYVALTRRQEHTTPGKPVVEAPPSSAKYLEGARGYVRHLRTERNQAVVVELKATRDCICDICNLSLLQLYGVECIEAHHCVPISSWSSQRAVTVDDFVLLCPNCHRAVHKISRAGKNYAQAKQELASSLARYRAG